jgi:hypothetical protein
VDERAHQYAVQDAVLRPVDHSADHSGHPVHGRVDPARQPQDRRCRTGSGWKGPCSTSIRCGG